MSLIITKTHIIGSDFCLPLEGLTHWYQHDTEDLILGAKISIAFVYSKEPKSPTFNYGNGNDNIFFAKNYTLSPELNQQIVEAKNIKHTNKTSDDFPLGSIVLGSFMGSLTAMGGFAILCYLSH